MQDHKIKSIAVVSSVFNKQIHERLKEGALDELKKSGVQNVKWVDVPGVIEIPLTAQWLFQNNYALVIALGAVIRGETSHYDACCRMVETGCMKVQLKMNRPIVFGILMTDSREQALARSGGEKGHIGRSAVRTALQMLKTKKQFTESSV